MATMGAGSRFASSQLRTSETWLRRLAVERYGSAATKGGATRLHAAELALAETEGQMATAVSRYHGLSQDKLRAIRERERYLRKGGTVAAGDMWVTFGKPIKATGRFIRNIGWRYWNTGLGELWMHPRLMSRERYRRMMDAAGEAPLSDAFSKDLADRAALSRGAQGSIPASAAPAGIGGQTYRTNTNILRRIDGRINQMFDEGLGRFGGELA